MSIRVYCNDEGKTTMLISEAKRIEFLGRTAQLNVVRNNGSVWGVITLPSGEQFDVTDEDLNDALYDSDDDYVYAVFIANAAKNVCIEPAATRIPNLYCL